VGFNYSLSNLQAAVGLAQLECLTEKLAARRAVAERYVNGLADIEDLRFCSQAEWAQTNFWLMSVLVDPQPRGRTRDSVMAALADRGIAARPFFAPLCDLPPYAGYAGQRDFPVARRLHAHALSIPSSPTLTSAEQEEVIDALRDG
jgi:dTDP-4-amino-4,6-dideoxygalactose transaminase